MNLILNGSYFKIDLYTVIYFYVSGKFQNKTNRIIQDLEILSAIYSASYKN